MKQCVPIRQTRDPKNDGELGRCKQPNGLSSESPAHYSACCLSLSRPKPYGVKIAPANLLNVLVAQV